MSLIDKLNNIINCKDAIRAAINNKGGVLTENSKLRDYAAAIDNLTAGGGSEDHSGLIAFLQLIILFNLSITDILNHLAVYFI